MNKVQQKFILFCFFVTIIVMGTAILVVRSISGTPPVDPAAKSKNIDIAERGLTLQERLGVDDNAALAFIYGADMQGSLDLCG
jgi:hypothetical protein